MEDQTWDSVYHGDSTLGAYQEQFQQLAPVSWDVIETTQGDLLAMVVNRVEASVGAPVILALGSLGRDRADAETMASQIIETIMASLAPRRAKTVLASIAAGWRTSTGHPIDDAPGIIAAEIERAIRRLRALDLPQQEQLALDQMQKLLYPVAKDLNTPTATQQETSAGTT